MNSDSGEEVCFLAGQLVPPGVYVRVDAWPERRVVFERDGVLPASFDGQVACYRRRPDPVPAQSRPEAAHAAGRWVRKRRAASA